MSRSRTPTSPAQRVMISRFSLYIFWVDFLSFSKACAFLYRLIMASTVPGFIALRGPCAPGLPACAGLSSSKGCGPLRAAHASSLAFQRSASSQTAAGAGLPQGVWSSRARRTALKPSARRAPEGCHHQRVVFLAPFLPTRRSEEHTSELQSLMRISYAVFCLKKKKRIYSKQTAID